MRDTGAAEQTGSVLSVQKAIRILNAFTAGLPEWGARELGLRLGMPRSVVQRLLQTLAQGGLLEQDQATQKYRVGLRAFEIGRLYVGGSRFQREGLHILREMAAATTYTCYLGILDGHDAVALAVEYGPNPVRIVGAAGDRFPAHASAFGKAILSTLPDEQVLAMLGPGPLRQLTAGSAFEPGAVLSALASARRAGYAVSAEETYPGVTSIGAPVYGPGGRAAAALSVSLSSYELQPGMLERLGQSVTGFAAELARRAPEGP
ncbi:MAG: putative IclR family transcriptional regulator [Symbiobacteriaceae bacterium]|jgi:DNA-binding IclR family transcriptional regulator|nr:putative IclR family transcriptional regulator [Symbiobacteriaceae bacterium]